MLTTKKWYAYIFAGIAFVTENFLLNPFNISLDPVFPKYELECDAFSWTQDKDGLRKAHVPPYKSIHLYDGAMYCYLGMSPYKRAQSAAMDDETRQSLSKGGWLSEEVLYAQRYKTTLHRLSPTVFDIILRHGYESAKMSHRSQL